MMRTRCPSCKKKLEAGQRIHPECIDAYAEQQAAKAERAKNKAAKMNQRMERESMKARKDALKSKADFAKEAQIAVNAYVRARDANDGCISCKKTSGWNGQWHASHFRSVGAASAVRFNLWNIHKACSVCNNYLSGNISEYEPRLRMKIGDEKVDWLKSQNQTTKYEIEYLKRLKKIFRKKLRRISR